MHYHALRKIVQSKDLIRRWLSIAGVIAAAAWLVFISIAFGDAGTDLKMYLIAVYCGLLGTGVWVVRCIMWFFRRSSHAMSIRRTLVHLGLEPAVLSFAILLVCSGAPRTARFRLSTSDLRAYVDDVQAGTVAPFDGRSPARRVGLYTISETERLAGGIVRLITSTDFFDDAGFVYSPMSEPPRLGEDSYTHLAGPWWHWHRSW